MKVKVEIDSWDIFSNTSNYREDSEIVEDMIEKVRDDKLIDEIINRNLIQEVFDNLSSGDQQSFMDNNAEAFGYIKE